MIQPTRVAVLAGMAIATNRQMIRGIYKFAAPGLPGGPWMLKRWDPVPASIPALRNWDPDGVIADLGREDTAARLGRFDKPLVNVSGALELPFPRIDLDDAQIGRMAAQHFLEKEFTHLGFFSTANARHSHLRKAGFVRAIEAAGLSCHLLDTQTHPKVMVDGLDPTAQDELIRRWVQELPKPVGVMAASDARALHLAEICRAVGLHLPEEVAILGVDDDDLTCNLCYPPLSSIRVPMEKLGYEAARLLARLMAGKRAPRKPLHLPPVRVVVRQSTDVLAIADRDMVQVLRFIREHAGEPITVRDVLRAVPVSRRALEQKFRALLGRSPLQVIRRAHIERAKQLLTDTDMQMPAVAEASGFANAARLSLLFRREVGVTPSQFRHRSRIH